MKLFRIDYDGVADWFFAEDGAAALASWRTYQIEQAGVDAAELDAAEPEATQVLDDQTLSVDSDDGGGQIRKTAAEWVAEVGQQPGFFCSSEY